MCIYIIIYIYSVYIYILCVSHKRNTRKEMHSEDDFAPGTGQLCHWKCLEALRIAPAPFQLTESRRSHRPRRETAHPPRRHWILC